MSSNIEQITRRRVGELPLLTTTMERLGINGVLQRHLPDHGNQKNPVSQLLTLMIFNITSSRYPLYQLGEWSAKLDLRYLKLSKEARDADSTTVNLSDDQFARALDKLYDIDRATMMTEIILGMVKATSLTIEQIHNDSTSVKTYGQIKGKTKSGVQMKHGHSKDHRPDLKQLVFSLSITADGAVPIHYKIYPGNTTDDRTHIETWSTLKTIFGRSDFLYVADCKLCTGEQLEFIAANGGRAVTIMPRTWGEYKAFITNVQEHSLKKKAIFRKLITTSPRRYNVYSRFEGEYFSKNGPYTIHWIHSSEKHAQDVVTRARRLEKSREGMQKISLEINRYHLKSRESIEDRVKAIIKKNNITGLIRYSISEVSWTERKKIGRGRPGPNAKYESTTKSAYEFTFADDEKEISKVARTDGIFPLLCTDPVMTAQEVLQAYKYQPQLEKRFCQLKSIHSVSPLLFKKITRVESMLFLYFIALILQSTIERQVRSNMSQRDLEAIPVYPEHRLSYCPTTAAIFDRFEDVSTYSLKKGGKPIGSYKDQLSEAQQIVLRLMDIEEINYWGGID